MRAKGTELCMGHLRSSLKDGADGV
jgi:hypothetical protein